MSTRKFRPLKILWCMVGMAILLYSGYIVGLLVILIWHKAPDEKNVNAQSTREEKLFEAMIEGGQKDRSTDAYKRIDETRRPYHFHKTQKTAAFDSNNLCISCHGDIPHDKKKETRAFLNMHSFFMACEVCHIRLKPEIKTNFVWYDKVTGKEYEKIDIDFSSENTSFKLMPVKMDGTRFYDTEQMVIFVAEFKSKVGEMTSSEKNAALETVHKPMTALEDSVRCDECHKSDTGATYLPFKGLGYPERRVRQLVGNEFVGMTGKYKKFYLPKFLRPKEESE